jgi:hypothetical protein
MTTPLSRGARLCESIIRNARARAGGRREVGRPYLARRLDCSVRTVSRYIAELRAAGRLEVAPPRKTRTAKGWRTIGTNVYRLLERANPCPHVTGPARLRRSARDATGVTPPPTGSEVARPSGGWAPLDQQHTDLIDPGPAAAALLARLAARESSAA